MEDGISRLNTAPQLAETIMIDRHSKEHTQNKVDQKQLLQLKKHCRSLTKSETKLRIKSTCEECQSRSNLIYSQARTSSNFCIFMLCVM